MSYRVSCLLSQERQISPDKAQDAQTMDTTSAEHALAEHNVCLPLIG